MRSELESAFRQTLYRLFAPGGELLLRVDQPAPALGRLLRETGTHCAALLTAWNPDGRKHPLFSNRQRQQGLRNKLAHGGYVMIDGRNEDPRGLWPAEPTLLVPGLPLAQARRLAMRYGQAAFLWIDPKGTPRLIETAALPRYGY